MLMTSIVVPHVSNFRVMHHVHRSSGTAPMLFLATQSTVGSMMGKFRLKTGSCLGGPFNVRRLVMHLGTLVRGTFIRGRVAGACAVKKCRFGSIARRLSFTKGVRRLSRQRSRVLGHLYRGQGRIIGDRDVLLRL